MKWYLGLVSSLLFSSGLSADYAQATFKLDDSYVEGRVTVNDSRIMIDLNISDILNATRLPAGCVINDTSGLEYHVHMKWTHSDITSGYLTECNDTFTGGHYDPYGACGPSSGYPYCIVNGGCINNTYMCSSSQYRSDAYTCEVGDWSGKYGLLSVVNGTVSVDVQSFGDITGKQLEGKSIVFHCANNKARAFCASFKSSGSSTTNTTRRQINGYKLMADFGPALCLSGDKVARFTMNYNGLVEAKFSSNAFQGLSCPGDQIAMWIGDAWTDNNAVSLARSSCTSYVYGVPYDPTNQCYNSNITSSDFCLAGELCGASNTSLNYTYMCNYTNDPFSCSPMDLSGRYGITNLTIINRSNFGFQKFDRYMADLSNLVHKSVVLTCIQNKKPLLCAKLQNIAVGKAVATFINETSGADGNVTVMDGEVAINVSFAYAAANFLNGTILPTSCFENGLKAHIHQKWTYNDTTPRYGPIACSKTFTGGHWDPWAACSKTTDYTSVCRVPPSPSPTSCVDLGGSVGNGTYLCNSTEYLQNPFSCEVGDWSGKYGIYQFSNGFKVQRTNHSAMEVNAIDLIGKSVVFHCANDDTRAFCAPFQLEINVSNGEDHKPTWTLSTQSGNMINQASVQLNNNKGSVMLESNGYYSVNMDISADTTCSSAISYAVFTDNSCTKTYDPTIQCLPLSEYNGTLCDAQETCGVTNYRCAWTKNAYSCSPSDLSGKYGISDSNKKITAMGWDDLMIPLSDLQNKYLGLYCNDTLKVIECHAWDIMVNETMSSTSTTEQEEENIGHIQKCGVSLVFFLLLVISFL